MPFWDSRVVRPTYQALKGKYSNFRYRMGNRSYAQEGEDRVLSSLLFKLHGGENRKYGFYVDVGAHHQYRFSNTYMFYRLGWNGINIDAMPGSMRGFRKNRSRDINLEMGVADLSGDLDFYVFNEPALNTFDKNLALARCNEKWKIVKVEKIKVEPLYKVLDQFLPKSQEIDFITVDVEGLDHLVLSTNNWEKYRPLVVLAETFGKSAESLAEDEVYQLMKSVGYDFYSKTVNTSFFVDSKR